MSRKLSEEELKNVDQILDSIRTSIKEMAKGDSELQWAINRKIYKELTYDERGKPAKRKSLKNKKIKSQNGKCNHCGVILPKKNNHLDRLSGMEGYTEGNTQVLCHDCDTKKQESKNYT